MLPPLAESIDSKNSDLRVQSLRVLAEMCAHFFLNKTTTATTAPTTAATANSNVNVEDVKRKLRDFVESHFIDL